MNDEIRMSKDEGMSEIRMTKINTQGYFQHSCFVIGRSCFVIFDHQRFLNYVGILCSRIPPGIRNI
ncbi:MAG: hypothetical protein DMF41_12000 [Verrucomicrobia bacterium]|nr:MAG: hypothetical protein DMF41_12000 [Verrucomicrobiota bacterium]